MEETKEIQPTNTEALTLQEEVSEYPLEPLEEKHVMTIEIDETTD